MFKARSITCLFCLLAIGSQSLALDVSPESSPKSYALEAGKLEIGFITGIYLLETKDYYPGPKLIIGGDIAIGLNKHIALQFGASRTGYENDLYWRPEIPNNPYRATADLLNFYGEARYEFRQPAARIRPYLGAGIISTTFANTKRGPKDLCVGDTNCYVVVPELFEGTKVNAFLDSGLNFLIRPRWGIGTGIKWALHRGDESDPYEGISGRPSGRDLFWHNQWYFRIFYRWKKTVPDAR